ncbi:MAG TPA: hypothetical protein VL984_02560 [Acidimicrobiales bacterium]|nr:hypothetical protein [Acidimicrobiales bacterium]
MKLPATARGANGPATVDRGSSAPLTLLLGTALIVLPVMVLVLTLPTWEQRAVDAQDAARGAALALVTAASWATGVAAAEQVVAQVVQEDGLPAGDVSDQFSGSLEPGGTVTASVTVAMPVGQLPGLALTGPLHYTASSTQHVDSYRGSPG